MVAAIVYRLLQSLEETTGEATVREPSIVAAAGMAGLHCPWPSELPGEGQPGKAAAFPSQPAARFHECLEAHVCHFQCSTGGGLGICSPFFWRPRHGGGVAGEGFEGEEQQYDWLAAKARSVIGGCMSRSLVKNLVDSYLAVPCG
jgi:hypothetical protein